MVSSTRIRHAAYWVKNGGVIAYPTEAVYGLGCDPWNEAAVSRLFALKQRSSTKGLILIAAEFAQLKPFLDALPPEREKAILARWPGPVTWVLPAANKTPSWLTGGRDTVAVRVTAHPDATALCRACDTALVSTSANRSGQLPARTAWRVRRDFGTRIDALVPGVCGPHLRPSTLLDGRTGQVLRA